LGKNFEASKIGFKCGFGTRHFKIHLAALEEQVNERRAVYRCELIGVDSETV